VGDTLQQLATYCQRDFSTLEELINDMVSILDSLYDSIGKTLDLVSCARVVPIYHKAIYDGACQYSVSAQFWVFSAALIMGTFGLLMILFRASYKPTIYHTPDSVYTGEGHEVVYEMPTPNRDNSFESETLSPPAYKSDANVY
jgi:hypothetical protein